MSTGNKTIYVLQVERQSQQGRHNYSVDLDSGQKISLKRSKARGIKIPIGFVRKGNSNILNTGLDKIVDNPYYGVEYDQLDDDRKPGSNWINRYNSIKEMERIDLQTLYEMMDDVAPGTYTSQCGTLNMFEVGADVEKVKRAEPVFLEQFSVYLGEGVNVFSSNTQRGRLGILACERHPKVANSKQEIDISFHEFYIGSAEEAVLEKNRKIDNVMESIGYLQDVLKNYDDFTTYQLAVILDVAQGNVSPATVEMNLKDFVWREKKTTRGTQEDRISEFNKTYDILTEDPNRIYIKYLVKQAINSGVFLTSGSRNLMWPAKKGYDNLYNLGSNIKKIENMFYQQLEIYDSGSDAENWFHDLENDLKQRGVKCR